MKNNIIDTIRALLFTLLMIFFCFLFSVEAGTQRTPPTIEEPPAEETQEPEVEPLSCAAELKTLESVQVHTAEKNPAEPNVEAPAPEEQPEVPEQAEPQTDPAEDPAPQYTEEELEMLALVIYTEAGSDTCSDDTRLMVGTVVMNRVADERFPDTIYDVLTQKAQYGTFHWTGLVWPERASNPNEAHAVERAYTIAKRILEGERAFEEGVIFQAEFLQGTEMVAYSDGMYFCK